MIYLDFLTHTIEDGIEAARLDYRRPDQRQKLEGSIKGFEDCRSLDPEHLKALLNEAHQTTYIKFDEAAHDYWYWRCREVEIEWVCNVVSAMLYNQGLEPLIMITARGVIKAADILGVG